MKLNSNYIPELYSVLCVGSQSLSVKQLLFTTPSKGRRRRPLNEEEARGWEIPIYVDVIRKAVEAARAVLLGGEESVINIIIILIE